jgi:hypothetical protein
MMRWIVVCTLFLLAGLLPVQPAGAPAAVAPGAALSEGRGSLLELLPESTLVAAEIHDAARRWESLRAIPAIAGVQQRLLDGSGLEPDDLPPLVGNRFALALVPARGGRTVIPVVVLRPADPDRVEGILDVRTGARPDSGTAWHRVRGRGALWIGPASAAGDVEAVARGDGTSLSPLLPVEEAASRLPAGGLVRGWVNPVAARRFLHRLAEGSLPAAVQLIIATAEAELDAVRWIAFRRDIVDGRVVADAVISYDRSRLPAGVARVFDPRASFSSLPATLPADLVMAAAYRPEPQVCLPWLRFLQDSDPRGPFRNVEFWIDEFEERSGLSLERDLFASLGEHGWEFLLESRQGESLQWAAVFEATDPQRVEAALLALRDWSADHALARSLGLARLIPRRFERDGIVIHGSGIGTFIGELAGPAFAVTERHVVVGIGDRAIFTALDLVAASVFDARADRAGEPAAHMRFVLRAPALARTLQSLVGTDCELLAAVVETLLRLGDLSSHAVYEQDGVRMHAEVDLTP